MRWFEPLAYALIVPVFQFVSFGDLFDLGSWQYHEWTMVPSPISIALAVVASLIVWGIAAGLVRLMPPRNKSPATALWLRSLGVFLLWSAVFAYFTFGDATFTRSEEMRSFQWALIKISLGVVAATLVALVARSARSART